MISCRQSDLRFTPFFSREARAGKSRNYPKHFRKFPFQVFAELRCPPQIPHNQTC